MDTKYVVFLFTGGWSNFKAVQLLGFFSKEDADKEVASLNAHGRPALRMTVDELASIGAPSSYLDYSSDDDRRKAFSEIVECNSKTTKP